MTKQEIFDKILETCADVCSVDKADIINACRKEDVCTARAILVFWCEEAGFSVESLVKCCECNSANSINSVRSRIEMMWKDKFAFHVLVKEVGKRLLDFAHEIGEEFDIDKPIRKMGKITGKY